MIHFTVNGIPCTCAEGTTILQAARENGIEIPNLCNDESVRVYGACGLCTVEVTDDGNGRAIPKLLRACSAKVCEGYAVRLDTARVNRARKTALALIMSDHTGDCRGPCQLRCPAETDCQGYLKKIAERDYHGAAAIIREKIPLPASVGRICPHPCESDCRRGLVEQPLSIAALKAFAADRDYAAGTVLPAGKPETGKRVAVVGGGPAGLTAAYFLRLKGHSVTVYDSRQKMGGMLRYGIPAYRLPKAILDREIEEIAALGVTLKPSVTLGTDITLADLRAQSDAVILATGAWQSMQMRIPGEELEGVCSGIGFLRGISSGEGEVPDLTGKRVAVCGGGNTAMDACRTAIRCGAEAVYVIYRRTREEMPAEDNEITEAMEEGVTFRFLTNPAEILGENGRVKQMRLQIMRLGEPDASGRRAPIPAEGEFDLIGVDTVIMAIGQRLSPEGLDGVELTKRGTIAADETTFLTNLPDVYAIGDATNRGASIAIEAIAEAGRCVAVVDSALCGEIRPYRRPYYSQKTVTAADYADREKQPRAELPLRPASERKRDFAAITDGLDEETAVREAKRCLSCGCHDYADCRLIRYAQSEEIHPERYAGVKHSAETEQRLVCIGRDSGKCLLCGLCVRICEEDAKQGILGLVGRGFQTAVKPEFRDPETVKICMTCGKCVQVCPTGALRLLRTPE